MPATAGVVLVVTSVFAAGETFAAVVVGVFVVHWFSD
jgi:hypothetical protein